MPALPVTAIILAEENSLFNFAKLFKKEIESLTFIIFELLIFDVEEVTTHPAPFFIASATNLLPSFFFPVIAKNKFSFLIDLVSIERPLKFVSFVFPITLLINSLFWR